MIITDEFVYVHMPKTGGTFVEKALNRLLAEEAGVYWDTSIEAHRIRLGSSRDQHDPVREIPAEHSRKKILCTVRNPYDHYVSFFEFGWWKTHPNDTFDWAKMRERYPAFPEISFAEYMAAIHDWRLLDPSYRGTRSPAFFEAANVGPLTVDYIHFLFPEPERVLDDLRHQIDEGGYRAELGDLHFIRTDDLNRELYDFLRQMGFARERLEFILHLGRILPEGSSRRPEARWELYYTPELKRRVREKERLIFSMFPEFDV